MTIKADHVHPSDDPQTDDGFQDDFRVIEATLRAAHAPVATLDRLARIRARLDDAEAMFHTVKACNEISERLDTIEKGREIIVQSQNNDTLYHCQVCRKYFLARTAEEHTCR